MRKATQKQTDDFDTWNYDTEVDDGSPSLVRQEFKDDADINILLGRYGIGVPQAPVFYADVDFDMDLTTAMQAIDQLSEGWDKVPEHLRNEYKNWPSLLDAIGEGKVKWTTEQPPAPPEPETPVPPTQ